MVTVIIEIYKYYTCRIFEACHCRDSDSDSGIITEVGDVHRKRTYCLKYRLSLLSCPRARQLYRIESLYPPVDFATAAVLSDTTKGTHVIFVKQSSVLFFGVLNNRKQFYNCEQLHPTSYSYWAVL